MGDSTGSGDVVDECAGLASELVVEGEREQLVRGARQPRARARRPGPAPEAVRGGPARGVVCIPCAEGFHPPRSDRWLPTTPACPLRRPCRRGIRGPRSRSRQSRASRSRLEAMFSTAVHRAATYCTSGRGTVQAVPEWRRSGRSSFGLHQEARPDFTKKLGDIQLSRGGQVGSQSTPRGGMSEARQRTSSASTPRCA
jgi:hypothetical protein